MTIPESIHHWLIAIRAPALAGKKLIDAVEAAGSISDLVCGSSMQLKRLGLSDASILGIREPDAALIEADLSWLSSGQRFLIGWDSEQYPALLRRIPSPPAALFLEGNPDLLWQPQLAVVGSRNPSRGGLEHAAAFSAEFCRKGVTITSGLASGIDSSAHHAALNCNGSTIAVTGTGLDRVYPASSNPLAARIRESGALVSELPLGSPPLRSHFPSRNRIISGLSLGVLVIEAGLNSGSLITARMAAEQGRDVFALPGSLHNPMIKGCHRLIREGARLVETANDVMSELAPMAAELASELRSQLDADVSPAASKDDDLKPVPDDPDYQRLWKALEFDPHSMDELIHLSSLPARSVSSMLLMLELKGLVTSHSSGKYSRVAIL